MFYKFDQNNSGGRFCVNEAVCHRLFIEADSAQEANDKAESLGCYWNGVEDGIDCECCGDRWHTASYPVDLERLQTNGWRCTTVDTRRESAAKQWDRKFGRYEIIQEPQREVGRAFRPFTGIVRLRNIEEYAQLLADEYGFTTPDCRIYYKDGRVVEVFSERVERWD